MDKDSGVDDHKFYDIGILSQNGGWRVPKFGGKGAPDGGCGNANCGRKLIKITNQAN